MDMEHDHSAHANASAATAELPPHPAHGTWEGHVLPGSFFLIWSTWWLVSIFRYVHKFAGAAAGTLSVPAAVVCKLPDHA